jgi:predicted transcriptional regulator
MINTFLRKKPCRMLTVLKDRQQPLYISELAKESNATYVHTTKLVRELELAGIVTIEKTGKKRMVKLTDAGLKIAGLLSETMSMLAIQKPALQPPKPAAQQSAKQETQ